MHPFEIHFATLWPPDEWRELTVLLAVSGGADSMALLRAVTALKTGGAGRVCVAHFNHKLRPEAEDDQQFVTRLCDRLGVLCEIGAGDVARLAAGSGEGIELAARRARHRFLLQAAGRLGARFVVTAHTADDQAETILHRIVRGTSIAGLAGMSRSRRFGPATLLRPMLTVRRGELKQYLGDIGQTYREDASNADRRFTRNRIRHELLPLIAREYNSRAEGALLRLGRLAAEAQQVIDHLVDDICNHVVKFKKDSTEIDAEALAHKPRYLLRQLLVESWRRQSWPMQAMGYVQWDQLAQMLAAARRAPPSDVVKQSFPGNVHAEMTEGLLRLNRVEKNDS